MQQELLEATTVGDFLTIALKRKQKTRKGMSLRLLASKLELSPAMLSQILGNRRMLKAIKLELISSLLGLSPIEQRYLVFFFK
jgi:transcriptional regulator with XRE-family HTH domain